MSKQLDAAAARIAELEKQLSELRIELITSYGESEELSGEVVAVKKQRDMLLAALEKSRAVFDSYVKLHRDKTPPDEEKAARNAFHRGVCDEAIASVKEQV